MNVRSKMAMRTVVRRNGAATQPDGNQGSPGWVDHLTDLPCYAWATNGREVIGGVAAMVQQITVIVPSGTDVTNKDRLGDVTDRQGAVRFPGPIELQTVTWLPGFVELQAVSSR